MLLLLWALGLFENGAASIDYPPIDPIGGDDALEILRVRRHRLVLRKGGR